MAYDLAALQALVDLGETVEINADETYTLDGPLLVDAGTKINLNGRIVRAFATGPGAMVAMIRNRTFGSVNGFHLYGRGTMTTASGAGGKMVAVLGNDMVVNGVAVDGFNDGQAFYLAGNNLNMRNVKVMRSSVAGGTGGIRICGGTDVDIIDCVVESGDDSFQVVPANSPVDPFFGQVASNVRFRRCTGSAAAARFIAVMLDDATTTNITDVAFYDCHGEGSRRVAVVENVSATGTLSGVLLRNCTLGHTGAPFGPLQKQEILVSNVDDVTFRNVSVLDATQQWFEVNDYSTGVTFEDCVFAQPAASFENGCTIWYSTGTTLRRNTFIGGGTLRGIWVNGVDAVVTNNNIAGLTSATAIVDIGTNSTISGNV